MQKIINRILIAGMGLGTLWYLYQALTTSTYDRLATYIAVFPLLLLPFIYEKITKRRVDENMRLIYYVFLFLADFLGCVVNLYNVTHWFDTFTHYLSGVLTALLAIIMMKNFKYKETTFGSIVYALAITALVALLWEIFEFTMDSLTGTTLQHVKETGVTDTMKDVMVAMLGSLTFLVAYLGTKKDNFLHKFIKEVKI